MNNFNIFNTPPQSGVLVAHNISGIVLLVPMGEPIPDIPQDLIDKVQQATKEANNQEETNE